MNMSAYGIMFHHFHDAVHPRGQGSISADQLEEMIHFVGRRHILDAAEWADRALSNRLAPGDICITLDDSLKCQFDIAFPVFQRLRIRAFWFTYSSVLEGQLERLEIYRHFRSVYFEGIDDFYEAFFRSLQHSPLAELLEHSLTGFRPAEYLKEYPFYSDQDRTYRYVRDRVLGPNRYNQAMDELLANSSYDPESEGKLLWMSADNLRELASAGHIVGLHSHTHPTELKNLSGDEQREQYRRNSEVLSGILGQAPTVMSHPCNSYDPRTLSILREMGVKLGFRANMAAISDRSELEYPREDHANLLSRMAS